MKTTTTITYPTFALFAVACFALAPATDAQCPQICDSNLQNTAFGLNALPGDGGYDNTAIGYVALFSNTLGSLNTAIGVGALYSNTIAGNNTAIGFQALNSNTTSVDNTAIGSEALYANTDGGANTATGSYALSSNMFGGNNTANGAYSLVDNTDGLGNTATGANALGNNTTGSDNTATGFLALVYNTTGNKNIALGDSAGYNLTTGNSNIDIGNRGRVGESKTIRIGKVGEQTATFIAGISGAIVPTGVAVIVDTSGHLGTIVSSARFKDDIQPMDRTSEAILALKPVTFRYKKDLDPEGVPQFGLVAEDVAKVNPDLVARDEQGKPYTVRYEAVNAMLLNEFLKEHKAFVEEQRKVQEQDCKLQEQAAIIAQQQKQIEALTAGLQKVSAQLELSKRAPEITATNQ